MRRADLRFLGLAALSGMSLAGCPLACPAMHWNTSNYGDGGHAGHTGSVGGTGGTGGTGGMTDGGGNGGHTPEGGTVEGLYSVLQGTGFTQLKVVGMGVAQSGEIILAGWYKGDGSHTLNFGGACAQVSTGTNEEGFVVRLDADLKCLEVRQYNGNNNVRLTALSVAQDSYAVAGTYQGTVDLPSGHDLPAKPTGNGAVDAFVSVDSVAPVDGGVAGVTYSLTGTGVEAITSLTLSIETLYLTGTVTGAKSATFTAPAGASPQPTSTFMNWGFAVSATRSATPQNGSSVLEGDGTVPYAITVDGSGLVSIVGQAGGTKPPGDGGAAEGKDAFLVQYGSSWAEGNALHFGGPKDQAATAVLSTAEGLYVSGVFEQQLDGFGASLSSGGGSDAFLGLIASQQSLPPGLVRFGSKDANDVAFAAMAADSSAFYAAGGLTGPASLYMVNGISAAQDLLPLGTTSVYLFKMDPQLGSLKWGAQYGNIGLTQAADAVAIGTSGPILAGHFSGGLYLDATHGSAGDGIFVAKIAP